MRWDEDTFAGYHASLDSLEDLLDSPATSLTARFAIERILQHVVDMGIRVSVIRVAYVAGEAVGSIKPTEEYLADIAAAVARQFNALPVTVEFRHGWPVLLLGSVEAPSMAEAVGASSLGRGGCV